MCLLTKEQTKASTFAFYSPTVRFCYGAPGLSTPVGKLLWKRLSPHFPQSPREFPRLFAREPAFTAMRLICYNREVFLTMALSSRG